MSCMAIFLMAVIIEIIAITGLGCGSISVCPTWQGRDGFAAWLAHIGPMPKPGMTQDRFPNRYGNYEPGNVRWATQTEQQNNKENNVLLTHAGKTQTIAQWARELGLVYSTLAKRLLLGWGTEKALTQAVRKRTRRV